MKKTILRKVNLNLRHLFGDLELVKGNGYFYFAGSAVELSSIEAGVYGCGPQLNALSLKEWIAEAQRRVDSHNERAELVGAAK